MSVALFEISSYNTSLQLTQEDINNRGGGLYSKTINRNYATSGIVGRYTGLSFGVPPSDGEYSVSYRYDSYGRFTTVTNNVNSDIYTYAYLANSN